MTEAKPLTDEQIEKAREHLSYGPEWASASWPWNLGVTIATIDALTAERDEARDGESLWKLGADQAAKQVREAENLRDLFCRSATLAMADLETANARITAMQAVVEAVKSLGRTDGKRDDLRLALSALAPTADREGTDSGGTIKQEDDDAI